MDYLVHVYQKHLKIKEGFLGGCTFHFNQGKWLTKCPDGYMIVKNNKIACRNLSDLAYCVDQIYNIKGFEIIDSDIREKYGSVLDISKYDKKIRQMKESLIEMSTVTIQDRKLKYLLSQANTSMSVVNERFQKIDEMLSQLEVGDKVYDHDCYGDAFEQVITNIIDRDNGIIEVHEKSINKIREACILEFTLTPEEIF